MKKLILISLLLTGCASTPNGYGQMVFVTGGQYKGQKGRLIKDCSGFENYQVELFKENRKVCIRIWNLERMWW